MTLDAEDYIVNFHELYFEKFMFTTENVQYHSMHLFWSGFEINVILYDCAMHCYFINIRHDNANMILSWLMMKNVDVEYIYMDTNINTFEVIIEINI